VTLALQCRWQEAIEVNEEILRLFPQDVEAYNRLGRAWIELGESQQARRSFEKALGLAPTNAIARRNLERLAWLGTPLPKDQPRDSSPQSPRLFEEETGKSGVTSLIRQAPEAVLRRMSGGESVFLHVEKSSLIVRNRHGDYLGEVEPKLALRLTKGGNRYAAAIVTVGSDELRIIIKETFRPPGQERKPSFPTSPTEGFRSYVKSSLLQYGLGKILVGGDEEEEEEEAPEEEEEKGTSEVAEEQAAIAEVDNVEAEEETDEVVEEEEPVEPFPKGPVPQARRGTG
jgi:tetratricopeptide (TPR) repeat protein